MSERTVNTNVDDYRAALNNLGDEFQEDCATVHGEDLSRSKAAAQMLQAGCERIIETYMITATELNDIYEDLSEKELHKLVEVAAVDLAQAILASSCEAATGAIFNRYNNMILVSRKAAQEGI